MNHSVWDLVEFFKTQIHELLLLENAEDFGEKITSNSFHESEVSQNGIVALSNSSLQMSKDIHDSKNQLINFRGRQQFVDREFFDQRLVVVD